MRNPIRPSIRILSGAVGIAFAILAAFFLVYYPGEWLLLSVLTAVAAAFLLPALLSSPPPVGATRRGVRARANRLHFWAGNLAGLAFLGLFALGVTTAEQLPGRLADHRAILVWALVGLLGVSWVARAMAAYYQSQAES